MHRFKARGVPERDVILSSLRFMVVGLFMLGLASCGGEPEGFLPAPLTDLTPGESSKEIMARIGTVGKIDTTEPNKFGRRKVTWKMPISPYFKRIEMEFTEKDRMYLARFVLKDEVRMDVKTVKQKLFDRYKISWEDPNHFGRGNTDVLVYAPELGSHYTAFEMTDTLGGEKSIEIFSTNISGADRPPETAKSKEQGQAAGDKKKAPSGMAGDNTKLKPQQAEPTAQQSPGTPGTKETAGPNGK